MNMKIAMSKSITYIFISALLLCCCALADAVTPPGTIISNIGHISYKTESGLAEYNGESNEVHTEVGQAIAPDLKLSKSGPNQASPGDEITYELGYQNDGTVTQADATGVVITDILPPGVNFVGASDDGKYNPGDGTVIWQIGFLPFNQSGTVQLTVKVDENLTVAPHSSVGKTLENLASITCVEGTTINVFHTTDVMNLSLEKIGPAEVFAYQTINYEIKYENDGNAPFENVLITDAIPEYTTFVSATGDYTHINGVITWAIPQLAVGASGAFYLTVQPMDFIPDSFDKSKLAKLPDGTIVTNEATISENSPPYRIYDRSSTTTTVKNPTLYSVKEFRNGWYNPTKEYANGDIIPYVISYKNNSTTTTYKNVRIEDSIPKWTKFKNAPGAVSSPISGSVEKVTWLIDDVEPGEEGTITLEVEISGVESTETIINEAKLTSDEPELSEMLISPEIAAICGQNLPNISLVANPKRILGNGRSISHLTAEVLERVPLEDSIPVPVPDGTEVTLETDKGYLKTKDGQWTKTLTLSTINGIVETDLYSEIISTVKVPATPKASAKGVEADTSVEFVSGAIAGVVTDHILGQRVSGVLVHVPNNIVPDETETTTDGKGEYSVLITETLQYGLNYVTTDFEGVKLEIFDDVYIEPRSGEIYYPQNIISGTVLEYSSGRRIPDVTLRLINANTNAVVRANIKTDSQGRYEIKKLDRGKYHVEVTQSPQGLDPDGYLTVDTNPDGHVVINANIILGPQRNITKSVDKNAAFPGDVLTYTIRYKNNGARLENLRLIDPIQDNAEYVSEVSANSATASLAGNEVTWTFPVVDEYESVEVQLIVRVKSDTKFGDTVENQAYMSLLSNPADMISSNTVKTEVNQLNIIKSADKDFIAIEEDITYTLTVKNPSTIAADDVYIIDNLPDGMSVINISDGGNRMGEQVVWNIGSLGANEEKSVTISLLLNEDIAVDEINNTAIVKHNDAPVDEFDISIPISRLYLKKTAGKSEVAVNEEITYTLEYGNKGGVLLTDVEIKDALPKELEWIEGGIYIAGEHLVVFNAGNLPLQANRRVTCKAKVTGSGVNEVVNTASIHSKEVSTPVTVSLSIPIVPNVTLGNAPQITLTTQFFQWESGKIKLEVDVEDEDDNLTKVLYKYSLDNADWKDIGETSKSPYGIDWDTSSISCDDSVWVRAIAEDATNLRGEDTSGSFGVDNESPTTQPVRGEAVFHDYDGKWHKPPFTITLTADDGKCSGVAKTRYKLNGGDERSGTAVKIEVEGRHELEYWSIDKTGNEEPHKTLSEIKIDATPPKTTIVLSGTKVDKVALSAEDSLSGVDVTKYRLNGGNWQDYSEPFVVDSDGEQTVEFYSTDKVGNQEEIQSETPPKEVTNAPSKFDWTSQPKGVPIDTPVSLTGLLVPGIKDESVTLPDIANEIVTLEFTAPDGIVKEFTVETDINGAFKKDYTFDSGGNWTLKASWDGNDTYQKCESKIVVAVCIEAPKAIVVLGGDKDSRDFDDFNTIANKVYRILTKGRGFRDGVDKDKVEVDREKRDVYYLNPQKDQEDKTVHVDAFTSKKELKRAITVWAAKYVGQHTPLLIYLLSHNTVDNFLLEPPGNAEPHLTPNELDNWISKLENALLSNKRLSPMKPASITLFIDACSSGNFLNMTLKTHS